MYVLVTFESEGSRNIHIIYEHFLISSGMHIIHFPDIWFNVVLWKVFVGHLRDKYEHW